MITSPWLRPIAAGMLALASAAAPTASLAASTIVLDGSLKTETTGRALTAVGTVTSRDVTYQKISIPESVGLRAGRNLFQSFSDLSIGAGDAVVFTFDTATANLISRVTGGRASTIHGLLSVDPGRVGGTPAFFLINPAGVTFGAGAVVDVPGAFHVSTADYLKFPDGNFYVDTAQTSTFSSAAPEAFGFLGASHASILVKDDARIWTAPGQSIGIVGGDIEINNAMIATQDGGDIRIAAVGQDAVEVPLTGTLPDVRGSLKILNLGNLLTDSNGGNANAGGIVVSSGDITIDGQGADGSTRIFSVALNDNASPGSVTVKATGDISLIDGGLISTDTYSPGNAGPVNVTARNITIDGRNSQYQTGISSMARISSHGNAGNVEVSAAETLSLLNDGSIQSDTLSYGTAGSITLRARNVVIDQGLISSNAMLGSVGKAGTIDLTARANLSVVNGGQISSSTFSWGDAGSVRIQADTIAINGNRDGTFTGIFSAADSDSRGHAGSVWVIASGALSVLNEAVITSSTRSSGDAGSVDVRAATITVDGRNGQGSPTISSDAEYGSTGNAGSVNVSTGTLAVHHGAISSSTLGAGNAGNVKVSATGSLGVGDYGSISSDTYDSGNAGYVKVNAGRIAIDGGARISSEAHWFSSGNAGRVGVSTPGRLTMTESGAISSRTQGSGNAGDVTVSAGMVGVDGDSYISSSTVGAGNAGSVEVVATGRLSVTNGGAIVSNTYDSGAGGTVTVRAGRILIDGASGNGPSSVIASATSGSSGQAGSVIVAADESIALSNGGELSIRNDASVVDPSGRRLTNLTVTAPRISLTDGSITASSTGNISAGNISVNFSDRLVLDPSSISTSANLGNGGSIAVSGGEGVIILDHSHITTSVAGAAGNGGEISVRAKGLVLNTGFIQANTLAGDNAHGGNIAIDVNVLLPSANSLWIGGSTPYAFSPATQNFNVIQAAAPTGLSGVIAVSSPMLDISGSFSKIGAEMIDTGALSQDYCRIGSGSSLTLVGHGGLPPSARSFVRPEER